MSIKIILDFQNTFYILARKLHQNFHGKFLISVLILSLTTSSEFRKHFKWSIARNLHKNCPSLKNVSKIWNFISLSFACLWVTLPPLQKSSLKSTHKQWNSFNIWRNWERENGNLINYSHSLELISSEWFAIRIQFKKLRQCIVKVAIFADTKKCVCSHLVSITWISCDFSIDNLNDCRSGMQCEGNKIRHMRAHDMFLLTRVRMEKNCILMSQIVRVQSE